MAVAGKRRLHKTCVCSHQTILSWLLVVSFYRNLCSIEQYCDQKNKWKSVGTLPDYRIEEYCDMTDRDVKKGPAPDGRSSFSCVPLWLSKDVYHAPNPGEPDIFDRFSYGSF